MHRFPPPHSRGAWPTWARRGWAEGCAVQGSGFRVQGSGFSFARLYLASFDSSRVGRTMCVLGFRVWDSAELGSLSLLVGGCKFQCLWARFKV